MGKEKLNIKVTDDGDIKLTISEEVQRGIPRCGDIMYSIQPYPADDEDRLADDEIKEGAILAYSYSKSMIKATALTDDGEQLIINGDIYLPLKKDMSLRKKNLMVFTKEEDAMDQWKTLTTTSLNAAEELATQLKKAQDKVENSIEYLKKALEKGHH